jgi:hypothetical protein
MSCPTHDPVEPHLTPISGHTFSKQDEWWQGIVHSENQYGSEYVRLYLWRNSDSKGWISQHKWNVDPERWNAEKNAVDHSWTPDQSTEYWLAV